MFAYSESIRVMPPEKEHNMQIRRQSPESAYMWRYVKVEADFSSINISLSTITEEMARGIKPHVAQDSRIVSLEWEDLKDLEVPFIFLQYETFIVGSRLMSILANLRDSQKVIFEQMRQSAKKDN